MQGRTMRRAAAAAACGDVVVTTVTGGNVYALDQVRQELRWKFDVSTSCPKSS
jgi:outer membrane protein assembly factor BamB